MEVIHSLSKMRRYSKAKQQAGIVTGFVPTMGKFHAGHLSLMKKAKEEAAITVVSVFVNPIQFSPGEDYENYPRDPDGDKAMAKAAGVDVLFCPSAEELFPRGFSAKIMLPGVSDKLCGLYRPIHFSGVATSITKLFNIVHPDKTYLGEKDYQQLLVIKQLVKDLNMDTEIVGCPTIREQDGLAMSSRNVYLKTEERESALSLNRSLSLAQSLVVSGERNTSVLKKQIQETICGKPYTKIQYISICNPETLEELEEIHDKALAVLAVWVGKVRLIDNCFLSVKSHS